MAFNCNEPCIVCAPAPPGTRGLSPNDPNNPFLNLSSEGPDFDGFIGRNYGNGVPPVGSFFYAVGCVGFCVGTTQDEADLCAARQNMLCNSGNWPVTTTNPDYNPGNPGSTPPTIQTNRPLFSNTPQTCNATCPDGSTNPYTVPAGTIYAFNQASANAQAYSLACLKANQQLICLSELSVTRICFDIEASVSLSATGVFGLGTFAVVNGSLPGGMTLTETGDSSATISGTPTAGGVFTFTIGCTDFSGSYGERTYTLEIFGITNYGVLAAGALATAYSQTLSVAGTTVGTSSFAVTVGELPPGLTLNTGAGVISGSPTAEGVYEFSIELRDESIVCERDFSITVTNPAGVFLNIIWDAPVITLAGLGTGSASAVNNMANADSDAPAYIAGPANTASTSVTGNLVISPAAIIQGFIECFFTLIEDNGGNLSQVLLRVNGVDVYYRGSNGLGSVGDGNFTIPVGINQTVLVSFGANSSTGAPPGGGGNSVSVYGYVIQR